MSFPIIPPREYRGTLALSREQENTNLKTAVEEAAEDYKEFVRKYLDDPPSPLVKLPRREQWQRYQRLLLEAYRGNVDAAMAEADQLQDERYVERLRAGVAPLPLSEPWASMIELVPDQETGEVRLEGAWFLMEEALKRYRLLVKDFGQEDG